MIDEPEYHLNLARAQVRMGDYEQMLQALGNYLRTETDKALINRFEALCSATRWMKWKLW
jgi:hypothetical protein